MFLCVSVVKNTSQGGMRCRDGHRKKVFRETLRTLRAYSGGSVVFFRETFFEETGVEIMRRVRRVSHETFFSEETERTLPPMDETREAHKVSAERV